MMLQEKKMREDKIKQDIELEKQRLKIPLLLRKKKPQEKKIEKLPFVKFNRQNKIYTLQNYKIFPLKKSSKFESSFSNSIHSYETIKFKIELEKLNPLHIKNNPKLLPFIVDPYKDILRSKAKKELEDLKRKRIKRLKNEYWFKRKERYPPPAPEPFVPKKPKQPKFKESHPKKEEKVLEPIIDWTDEEKAAEKLVEDTLEFELNNIDITSRKFKERTRYYFLKLKPVYKTWCCYGWDQKFVMYHRAKFNEETEEFEFVTEKEEFFRLQAEDKDTWEQVEGEDSLPYVCIDLPKPWRELEKEFETRNFVLENNIEIKRREEMIMAKKMADFKEKYGDEVEYFEDEEEGKSKLRKLKKLKKAKVRRLRNKISENLGKYEMQKILRRIPGFDFKFTKEQLKMINDGNKRTIIIGRSGTGKSTCAILRMLAIDLLFIARKCLLEKQYKVTADDLKRKKKI